MLRLLSTFVLLASTVAFAAEVSGEFKGTWSSSDGNSGGKIRTSIAKTGESTWACKFFFTAGDDTEIEGKLISCSVDGTKVTGDYEAQVNGSTLRISTQGALTGDVLGGTYKTTDANGDSAGTGSWTASLSH